MMEFGAVKEINLALISCCSSSETSNPLRQCEHKINKKNLGPAGDVIEPNNKIRKKRRQSKISTLAKQQYVQTSVGLSCNRPDLVRTIGDSHFKRQTHHHAKLQREIRFKSYGILSDTRSFTRALNNNPVTHTSTCEGRCVGAERQSFYLHRDTSDNPQHKKFVVDPNLQNEKGREVKYGNEVQIFYVFNKPFKRPPVPEIVPERGCCALCQTDPKKNATGVINRLYRKFVESNVGKDTPQIAPCGRTSIQCQVGDVKDKESWFKRRKPDAFVSNEQRNTTMDVAEKYANPSTHCQADGIKKENNVFKKLFYTLIEPVECKCVSDKLSQINMKTPKPICTCAESKTQCCTNRSSKINTFKSHLRTGTRSEELGNKLISVHMKDRKLPCTCAEAETQSRQYRDTFKSFFHTVIEPVESKCVCNQLSQIDMKAPKLPSTVTDAETQSRRGKKTLKSFHTLIQSRQCRNTLNSFFHTLLEPVGSKRKAPKFPFTGTDAENQSRKYRNIKYEQSFFNRPYPSVPQVNQFSENMPSPKNEDHLKRFFHILMGSHECGCVVNKLRQIIPLINATKPECTCAEAKTQSRKYEGSYQRAGREYFYRDIGTLGFPKYTKNSVDNPQSLEMPMEEMDYGNDNDYNLCCVSQKPATMNRRVGSNGEYNIKCCHNTLQDTFNYTNSSTFCELPRCINSSSLCHIEGEKSYGGFNKLFNILIEAKKKLPQGAQKCCKNRGSFCQGGDTIYDDNFVKRLFQIFIVPNNLKEINPSKTVFTEAKTQSRKYGRQQQTAGKEIFRRTRGTSGVPKQRCKMKNKEEEPVYEIIDEYEEETCVEPENTYTNKEIGIGTNCNFTLGWFKDRLAYGEPKPQDAVNNTKIAIEQWNKAPLKQVQRVSTKVGASLKTDSKCNFFCTNTGTQSRKYRKQDLRAGRETFCKERQTSCVPKCKKPPVDSHYNSAIVNQPLQPPAPDRKAIRLGSDCSFCFEFYRDVPPESPENITSKADESQRNKSLISKFIRQRWVPAKSDECTCIEDFSGENVQFMKKQLEEKSTTKQPVVPKHKDKYKKEKQSVAPNEKNKLKKQKSLVIPKDKDKSKKQKSYVVPKDKDKPTKQKSLVPKDKDKSKKQNSPVVLKDKDKSMKGKLTRLTKVKAKSKKEKLPVVPNDKDKSIKEKLPVVFKDKDKSKVKENPSVILTDKKESDKEECRCESKKKIPLKSSQVCDQPLHMGSRVKFNFNFFKSVTPPKRTNHIILVDDIKEKCSCGGLTDDFAASSEQQIEERKRIDLVSSERDPGICDNSKPNNIDLSSPNTDDVSLADFVTSLKTTKKCLLEFMSKKNFKRLINGIEEKPKVKKQSPQSLRYMSRKKPELVCEAKCKKNGAEPVEPDKPFRVGSSFSFGYDLKNVTPKHEEPEFEEKFPEREDFKGSQLKTDLFRLILGKIRKRVRPKARVSSFTNIKPRISSPYCDPGECKNRKEMNKTWFTFILDNIRHPKPVAEEDTKKFLLNILCRKAAKKRGQTCCKRTEEDNGWFSYILSNIKQERKSIPNATDAERYFTEMLSETDHFRSCDCNRGRRRRRRKQIPYGEYRAKFSAPNKFIESDLSAWTPRSRKKEKEKIPYRVRTDCCCCCDYKKKSSYETDSESSLTSDSESDSLNFATT